jgi:cytochrome c-type biogenesis protein CcmE
MQILGKKIQTRTVLIILIVLLIILGGYYIFTNLPKQVNYLTPEDVMRNKDNYLNGGTIIIRGFYDSDAGAIASTMSNNPDKIKITLELSNIVNATDTLRNGIRFYFTGTLDEVNIGPTSKIVFVVTKIEAV